MPVRPFVCMILSAALATSAGCNALDGLRDAPEPSESAEAAEPADDGAAPKPARECGGADFPCTWGDVDDATVTRTTEIARLALAATKDDRSVDGVAAAIAAEADATVLGVGNDSVRFRVNGGRPAWVFTRTADSVPTIGIATLPPLSWAGPPASSSGPPIAENPPGRVPTKKALLLSPFAWQWQLSGATDGSQEILASLTDTDDYQGGVTLLENRIEDLQIRQGVGFEQFMEFGSYDAIHITTHGGTVCRGKGKGAPKNCTTAVASGDFWERAGVARQDNAGRKKLRELAGIELGYVPITASTALESQLQIFGAPLEITSKPDGQQLPGGSIAAGPLILLNTTFFQNAYPGGLHDKIVFMSACESARSSDLLAALAGEHTAVIGWNKVMQLDVARFASTCFWKLLVGEEQTEQRGEGDYCQIVAEKRDGGRSVEDAYAELKHVTNHAKLKGTGPSISIVIDDGQITDAATGARLEHSGDDETRAVEIIRLFNPKTGRRLQDGEFVELVGTPGDGKPDKLKVVAELIGVGEDGDPEDFTIHLSVDGHDASQTWKAKEKKREGVYHGEATIDLGFDLAVGKSFELEPWVEFPGNGLSRWHYENIGVEYFVVTISGPAFASPQTFDIPPTRAGFHAHRTGFLTFFDPREDVVSVSADASILHRMIAGLDLPSFGSLESHPLGEFEGGRNRWLISVYLQGTCPGAQCDGVTLSTQDGTLTLTRFDLGKGRARPHEQGLSVMNATFDVAAKAVNEGRKGEVYRVHGAMSLVE